MAKIGYSGKYCFTIDGITMAGMVILGNEIMKICNYNISPSTVGLVSGISLFGGILLDKLYSENQYEKLFRMCGIENKEGKVPLVIKKTQQGTETTLVIHLPEGISQKHFEKKQQELEQFLNVKIEYGFNKNLILTLINASLKTQYKYQYNECEKPLECYIGESNKGKFYLDIEKAPHMIVAGETNSGQSSLLRNMLLSLILNQYNIDIHLIDFQAVELGMFEKCKKVKSYGEKPEDFEKLLDELEEENERRLKLFRSVKNKYYIENINKWNKQFPEKALTHKIIFIDEFSRLAEKEYDALLEKFRTRVAMDRKVGIHYIVSMQRPDVKCISGSIKANMPTRSAFKTFSQVDSEVILDQGGAEKLKNQGRFLIKYCGEFEEVQALYVDSDEVRKILKQHNKFKTKSELEVEKKQQMVTLREKCINPYLKKDVKV